MRQPRIYLRALIALTISIASLLTGCGGGGNGGGNTTPPPVTPPPPVVGPAPTVSNMQPAQALAGSVGFTLTVKGTGFVSGASILWNGASRSTVFQSSTQLSATIPDSDLVKAGSIQVTIKNPDGGTSTAASFTLTGSTASVTVNAKQIVFDPTRQRIYASVASTDPLYANSIAVINPSTATVETSIPLTAQPNKIAISQDGKYLYASIDANGSFVRIDLGSRTVEATVSLGKDSVWGKDMTVGDMVVLPNSPSSVAIARKGPGSYAGVVVFDGVVQRPNFIPETTVGVNSLAVSSTGDMLYGYESDTSRFAFSRMKIDANGITLQDSASGVLYGYSTTIKYDSGKIFTNKGAVVDAASSTLAGQFVNKSSLFYVAPDVAAGKVYFLTGLYADRTTIAQYDPSTYVQLGSIDLPLSNWGWASSLIRCGSFGLAFISSPSDVSKPSQVVITTGDVPPPSTTADTSIANLPVNDVAYDSTRQKIYASVPSSAGARGNSIAVVNPTTQQIEKLIPVGSEPNVLAVAPDGSYLYVGLDGAGAVRKVDLATQTAGLQFSLGNGQYNGARFASSIAVMPTSPNTVVVSMHYVNISPDVAGVTVFDNGVARGNALGGSSSPSTIAFGDSPSTLYGIDSYIGFSRMTIDSSGIKMFDQTPVIVSGRAPILASGGRVYLTAGTVVDPSGPTLTGTFYVPSTSRAVVADDVANRVYFLADDTNGSGKVLIYAYDKTKFTLEGSLQTALSWGEGRRMVECGSGIFAVAANSRMVIISGGFTAPPAITTATNLPVNHMIADAAHQKIYASVPGRAGSIGNSIAIIDAQSQSITSTIFVGSEPNPIALSKDGSSLYVGLDGSGLVRKVDLTSQTAGQPFTTGMDSYGPRFADYISVMPGDSDVIAVSRRRRRGWSPRSNGVAIFDHGVQRPTLIESPFETINAIAFSDSGSELYGYNNETTGFDFYRMKVDSSGVSIKDKQSKLISGFNAEMTFDSGLVYSTNGSIVDPVADVVVGTFPAASSANSIALDSTRGRAYFLVSSYSTLPKILGYDKNTMVSQGAFTVPGVTAQGRELVRFGSSGFAFATSDDHIVFTSVPFSGLPDVPLDRLKANRLLYDNTRQKLYASVPAVAGPRGNSIAVIDPLTATIESSIFVGSEPNEMAMSQDGKYLYVGLDGAQSIRQVDLASHTAGLQFTLGADNFLGPRYAENISVMPGANDTIAVSRMYKDVVPRHAGVAIYKSGVQLGNTTPTHTGPNTIAFSDSASTLYGYNNDTTEWGFYTMAVDGNGVSVANDTTGLISDWSRRIKFDAGRVYSTSGMVVDVGARTVAGKFMNVGSGDAMDLDHTVGRAFFLDGIGKAIKGYDLSTYQPIGSLNVSAATSPGHDMVLVGASGFAVATDAQVLIVNGSISQPQKLSIATSKLPPAASGRPYNFTLAIGGGVLPVTWTLASGQLPPGLTLASNGQISGIVGQIASNTTYNFRVQVVDSASPSAAVSADLSILVKVGVLGSNGSCGTATPISFGRLSASLSPYGDIDVYSFDGTQGAAISIETFAQRLGTTGNSATSYADTVVELLDGSCSRIAMSDDFSSSIGDSQILGFTIPATGKYYIRVSDARGDGRPDLVYDLKLTSN